MKIRIEGQRTLEHVMQDSSGMNVNGKAVVVEKIYYPICNVQLRIQGRVIRPRELIRTSVKTAAQRTEYRQANGFIIPSIRKSWEKEGVIEGTIGSLSVIIIICKFSLLNIEKTEDKAL